MGYGCRVECDSVSPEGVRLTTFVVTFPRFILAEVNTHRMLSRNSASSRAVPVEKRIAAVEADPFVPESFGRNQKGMQAGESLGGVESGQARWCWERAMKAAVREAGVLASLGVHKQLANRLLEPFSWHTAVITATDWANFFALRCHPDAQPEFQAIAHMMRDAMAASAPRPVGRGAWHLPFVSGEEWFQVRDAWGEEALRKVSAGRCARVSCLTHDGRRDALADLHLAERLIAATPKHACYDADTEVLTRAGWKPWPQAAIGDEFLTLSAADKIEYQKASRLVDEPHEGEMLSVLTEHVDLLVTPSHNMLASRRVNAGFASWGLIPASDFVSCSHRVRLGEGDWDGPEMDEPTARLLGFFIGDGNYSTKNYNVSFRLRRPRKVEFLRSAASAAGFEVANTGDRFRLRCTGAFKRLAWMCYQDKQKCIPPHVLSLGRKTLLAVLDGLMSSDGSVSAEGRRTYTTTSPLLAGQFQELAVKVGLAASLRVQQPAGVSSWGGPAKECLSLCLFRPRNIRPRVGWTVALRAEEVVPVPYSGRVYCATVPNGTLYVRRNGKALWCGNSPFEHVATPAGPGEAVRGNFRGWYQFRHQIPQESVHG